MITALRSQTKLPERFDFAPIDTCEETMFAPGADMLVRALVREDESARVTFSAMGHKLDYTQTPAGITGTIDGQEFSLQRSSSEAAHTITGSTSAGPFDLKVEQQGKFTLVKGKVRKMSVNHNLERKDGSTGRIAIIGGKFD
jgi:hypothetical protein